MAEDKKENSELPKSKEVKDSKSIPEKSKSEEGNVKANATAKGGTRAG